MSELSSAYELFFTSPAGISLLTWLQERRISEHEAAEKDPKLASYHSMKAAGFGEILEHIDNVQVSMNVSPYSSGASVSHPQPVTDTPSTGLGTSL